MQVLHVSVLQEQVLECSLVQKCRNIQMVTERDTRPEDVSQVHVIAKHGQGMDAARAQMPLPQKRTTCQSPPCHRSFHALLLQSWPAART